MSLIEQAAKRLDELRRAGVDLPDAASNSGAASSEGPGVIEAAVGRLQTVTTPAAATSRAESAPAPPALVRSGTPAGGANVRRVELDLARIAAGGIVTPDAPRSQVADEFRVIKRPLITNATGKGAAPIHHGNLIMVTSALPGEGKSFSALNLAMSIAMELDHTVLLVDADVARPSLPRMLGIVPERGLLDVLVDSVDVADVLLKTNVEKLSVMTSGTQHVRATELLASEAMIRLLDDLATRYPDRIIIFDSPPLLPTTEARVLATHMGQIVVVVEAQHTAQSAVMQALATIEACPVKLMLLNKGRSASKGSNYGYGYGYGGYGYGR
jgi:exopolysaccharide/PEP-CTERM locus tyrosine autokinase